jgi:hypothetical protein
MALSKAEKCAGRMFREGAEWLLAIAWQGSPDSMPCSAQVSFFRHECPKVEGRTRAIRLEDVTVASPEIWVCWNEDTEELEALTPQDAQSRLDGGAVVEYEQILAGKFAFTWKQGKCGRCGAVAMSREGVLSDARPGPKLRQADLSNAAGPTIVVQKREAGLT